MAEATKLPVKIEKKALAPAAFWQRTPFEALRREIDRVFEGFPVGALEFPFGRRAFELELPGPLEASWGVATAVDVVEKGKYYEITAELPGLDEKNIEIKLLNDVLTIRGEKKEEKEEHEKNYYLAERRYGSFTRSFQVPKGVDTGKIDATFSKGVLTVTLPKTDEAQKNEKTIVVKPA